MYQKPQSLTYSSRDTEWDGQNFLSFSATFCPFTTLTTSKIKTLHLEMSSFHTGVPKITIIWCMLPEMWSVTEIFAILGHCLPFYQPNNLKNQNFEKTKKIPRDIILHLCATNSNHMIHGSWDMVRSRQNILSIGTILYPFTPLTTQKTKILKKWKKHLEISSFYSCVP